jgi:hypothetical protein
MRIANAPAPPLSPPRKNPQRRQKNFQSRADFFNAMALRAEKKRRGAMRKKYQATTKPEKFSTFENLMQAVD